MSTSTARKEMTFRTVWPFFAMAFGLSWGLASLAIFFSDQIEPIFGPIGYTNPLFILAVYAPGLSGIALVVRHYGLRGLGNFLKRLSLWRIPAGWALYLVLGIPAAFYLAAWMKGADLGFRFTPWYTVVPALLLGMLIGPMEEFGWRGVALPLLQRRFRPIVADLILSTLWAVWHVPAFLMSGTPQSRWSFPAFFIGVVSISFILTPLFNAGRGSILIAAFYHFQMNNPIWPDAQPYDSLVFALIAVLVVLINRKALFTPGGGVTNVLMPGVDEASFVGASSTTVPADSTLYDTTDSDVVVAPSL